MVSEVVMHWMGWSEVWYAHPGTRGVLRDCWRYLRWDGRWHVGNWSGRDRDLLCVRDCGSMTLPEADPYLSPGSRTIMGATFRAVWRYWRTRGM